MESTSNNNVSLVHQRHPSFSLRSAVAAVITSGLVAVSAAPAAQAQEQAPAKRSASQALMEEVVVSARKREESIQDVPLAVSAYGSDQLEALKVRDLTNLSVAMPNVSLDDAGSAKGYANFSIRGLGINSSIISIDPTVGVFVDGVYMGLSSGLVFDMFDIERVEVLRGPQGILFGRNVTGGAVLLNTKKPGDEFEMSVRAAVDGGDEGGGLNRYAMASVGGPLTDTFAAKFTAYLNEDDGWFENDYNGEDFGELRQTMYRGVGVWTPTDDLEIILRAEHSETDGDGPAAQSHTNGSGVPGTPVNNDRDSFDFSIDEHGFSETETNSASMEVNLDVGFGDGTITNIIGWRAYDADTFGDIDSQPAWLFHSSTWLESEQFSEELRYTGTFGNATVTTGVYYFNMDADYHERRSLRGDLTGNVVPFRVADGGGYYSVETMAVFGAVDYQLTDRLTLTTGLRYTREEKEAQIASMIANVSGVGLPGSSCNLVSPSSGESKCDTDFEDDDSWTSVSPKLGFTYQLGDTTLLYTHWTRGFRSGGYNLRNTSPDPADVPGPFDEEQVDNYEVGFKADFERGRLNAAVFYNDISDMQREINRGVGPLGVIQVVRNTADADIWGIELDGVLSITDNLVLNASLGWIDAEYTSIQYDISGDGNIDSDDKSLDLPRAPEWTYSVGMTHELEIGDWGSMATRVSYAYRDESAYTDDNLGYIMEQDIVNAGIDFYSNDGHWQFGIYGRNLLNEVKHGGDTQLSAAVGSGTFAPLAKGRVYGAEVQYNF